MKIFLYANSKVSIFDLPESVSGSYSFDVNVEEASKLINVNAVDGRWILFSTDDSKILDNNKQVDELPLEANKFYVIVRSNKYYLIFVTNSDEENVRTYGYNENFTLSVGTNNATMNYNCPYVDNMSFTITFNDKKKILLQLDSGIVFVNRNELKQKNYFIKTGDEIEICGAKILFIEKLIIVIAPEAILQINEQASGLYKRNITAPDKLENIEVKDKDLYTEEDYFSKAPRLRRVIEEKTIELSDPPQEEKAQDLPLILTMGPMLTMGISSVVMLSSSISQLSSGEIDFKDAAGPLIIGITMLVSTILWPLLTSWYNKRTRKKNNKKNTEKYLAYLDEKKKELENERKLQEEIIKENVISLSDCVENLKHRKLNFWDKRIDQSDFLVARIGVGNELLKANIDYPKRGFTIEENDLKEKVDKMVEEYKYINNVPIGYSFYENKVTAIMGDDVKSHYFINNILFQLLTFYSYDDLKIVVFTNDKNKDYWNYVKYLNHNMTNDNSFRFFASTEDNASIVTDILKRELNGRLEATKDKNETPMFKPYYFVIVDDLDMLKKTNFVEELTELKVNLGFSLVILEKKLSKLPSLCNNFINLGDTTSGVLKNSYEKQEQLIFQDEINYVIDMMSVSKILANIPIEFSSNEEVAGDLPESITFLEMAKVGKVEQLNIMNRWDTNDSTSNLKAEVGVGTDGKLLYLDLHEKAHGPHGLIAGMTGSGKSEFIITWILSLSMNFSPEDVAFILIDYKGGGLAFAFENQTTGVRLPHLTGTITNLDKAEINRTLVSIDSEVKRRQAIFNAARDKLGESTIDIYKYQAFYHDGKLDEPLPHLFIVCDEFAELKAQQPDFMDNLISVARIGRSLGVHLILATQKPSGVVNDQIWSNTKFRVCLKVQDASDSNEMLKKPDAASLKQTGRFYLQVGYDEYFALGQSGWAGAKYYPSDILQKTVDKSVNIIDETGIIIKNIQAGNNNSKKVEAQGEQLSAVMNEIINVATQSNRFARRLWLENIKEDITFDEVVEKYKFENKKDFDLVIGEYDAPENQTQAPLVYNILKDGNTNIIGTDSSESEELINTMIFNIMKNYLPTEISYYVIDYGSQNFLKYKNDPHCGGVVTPGDTEEYNNLLKLLREEQKSRKKILSEFGGEYVDYVKQNPNKMPIMLVIFNNWESILGSNQALFDDFGELIRDSERYGIVYIVTSSAVNAVPDKFKQLMPYTLALKLKDPTEYTFLFNTKDKIEPRDLFGRGICFNEKLHEFQTAFISKDRKDINNTIVKVIEELKNKKLEPAERIPSLPEQVVLADVQKKLKGINKVPVGIENTTLDIKALDLTLEVGKLVLSSKVKYLNSFANSFVDELLFLKKNVIIVDPMQSMPKLKEKTKNYFDADLSNKLPKITSFVEQHKDKENILIIVLVSKLIDKLGDSSLIEETFNKFKELGNQHIVIFDEQAKIKDLGYEEWFKKIDTSEGVYIGPGIEDQSSFKINNYNRDLGKQMPKNYGYYIADGMYNIIKLIEFERIEDDPDDE